MTKYWFFSILILLLFCLPAHVSAQQAYVSDSLTSLDNTISFYRQKARDNSYLYYGREYIAADNRIEGHAYFLINEWQNGSLHYMGQLYQNVPMLYDIATEELVVKHYAEVFRIKLFNEKINYFTLSNHLFINLAAGLPATDDPILTDAKGSAMMPGFYDLLSDGNNRLLVKRKKIIKETIDSNELHREFIQKNFYFIEKDGVYIPVNNKRSALKVLSDQKKEIRQYLKKNNIKFRKNRELALVSMVEYYNQATDQL